MNKNMGAIETSNVNYWDLLKEYARAKGYYVLKMEHLTKRLRKTSNTFEIMHQIEKLTCQFKQQVLIHINLDVFYNSNLIIDGCIVISNSEIRQFIEKPRAVFITSLSMGEITDECGECELECVIYTASGFPLHMKFTSDYSPCDYGLEVTEMAQAEGVELLRAENDFHFAPLNTVSRLLNIKQDISLPSSLNREQALNTILYYWFSNFLLGKKKMGHKFTRALLETYASFVNEMYCNSWMEPLDRTQSAKYVMQDLEFQVENSKSEEEKTLRQACLTSNHHRFCQLHDG